TVWISRSEFRRELPRLIDRMDQPSIDGVNSYFVGKAAADAGLKVALSGLGGDELFGSYPSFHEIPRLVNTVSRIPGASTIGRHLRLIAGPLVAQVASPKYAGVLEYGGNFPGAYLLRRALFLPSEISKFLDPDLVHAG